MIRMSRDTRYNLLNVGLSGIALQAVAVRIVPHVPSMLSANMITFIGLFLSASIVFVIKPASWMAGCMVLGSLFLDFVDGALARQRNTASNFGRILDATSDLGLWLGILAGLYVSTGSVLPVAILLVYTIDVSWRHQLGHSTSILMPPSDTYERLHNSNSAVNRMKKYYYPFINYYDSVSALAILLIIAPGFTHVWLVYELIRRMLVLCKKIAEIYQIYIESRPDGRRMRDET